MNTSVMDFGCEKHTAVRVQNAYKRYGVSNVVLNGLNMSVPQGTVYGLLGPSGCGKTTLLHSIVGRCEIDAGEIEVKAKKKSKIGYMPQEIALHKEFTIIETMTYYGRLSGLETNKIESRAKELLKFLELPNKHRIINSLSGGQERRVSFAVAILHNPELLILDEPTVGVDPVLSASIWEHLLQMAIKDKKTIVITTHYIEEARQSHTIGLMRNGQLLAEESPTDLMIKHNCSNLEQAFLELSKKQHKFRTEKEALEYNSEEYPTPKKKPNIPVQQDTCCSPNRIIAQTIKNYYFMKRNKPLMGLLLFLPIVQCFLCCLCVGRDPRGLKVAVVDEELESGIASCKLLPVDGCNFSTPLSCRYLRVLQQKTYELIEYRNLNDAKMAIKLNEVWAVVYFSNNYTKSLDGRVLLNTKFSLKKEILHNISFDFSDVIVWQDMSNQYIGNLMRRDMFISYIEFLENLFFDCGWPRRMAGTPMKIEKPVYGDTTPKFTHFMVPALLMLFEFYLPMAFTVCAILLEKMSGLLERSLIAGVTVLEIGISHVIVQFIVLSIQTASMMFVLYVVYDNPLEGNLFSIIVLLFLIGANGMCFGFVVSLLCDTIRDTTYVAMGSSIPLALLSGMLWPYEGMHWILRSVGWLLPITLPCESLRAISIKGKTIFYPAVYKGFFTSIGWIIFFLFLIILVIKKNDGMRSKK